RGDRSYSTNRTYLKLTKMKRYLLIIGALIASFTILFFVVEALGVPLLSDPTPWLKHGGVLAASLGVGLLIADVVLPVPSSLVMVAHGALFGVVVGTLLSLLGSLGAALFGFAIGRRGGKVLERLVTPAERARADYLLTRWGTLAIIVTRPIPLLAETVAIIAGTSRMSWASIACASLVGSLPPALLYALTGAAVANFQSTALMFGVVLVVAGLFWLAGRLLESILMTREDRYQSSELGPDS
ncbi:MAG TPA: VTT domain-containing protein, partial [Pyrinomonadaceae bacterium]|nr:VTT domain-containing protein [Pyrinomonadaceae bacterium]